MAYDGSSDYGDFICDEYDEQNNFMNPPSSTGYYVYKVVGGALDKMKEMTSTFMNDYSVLSADHRSLDYFWGLSYKMPRPTIGTGASERLLTDDEYRIYLYLRNSQLITMQNLIINLGKCFNHDDLTVTFEYEEHGLETVDHPHYIADVTETSDLAKHGEDSPEGPDTGPHFVTDYSQDSDDTELIRGVLTVQPQTQLICLVPPPNIEGGGNWDPLFLEFLEQYISLKGNVILREAST